MEIKIIGSPEEIVALMRSNEEKKGFKDNKYRVRRYGISINDKKYTFDNYIYFIGQDVFVIGNIVLEETGKVIGNLERFDRIV